LRLHNSEEKRTKQINTHTHTHTHTNTCVCVNFLQDNLSDCRCLSVQLLAAGHEMDAVARAQGDGKGVSLDQLNKLCMIGFQGTDDAEALGAVLDRHITKLSESAAPAAAAAPAAEPGAQV
jgi:hypothetical protein